MSVKVSIITVVLNDCAGLQRTVESVRKQTSLDYEYIIIDGESTDGTQDFLRTLSQQEWWKKGSHQISIGKDSGIYNAMNKGVALAHGEFCLFLNAGDTLCSNNTLERVNICLNDGDVYSGHLRCVGFDYSTFEVPYNLTLLFLIESTLPHPSSFIRTSLLQAMPYNEELKICSDWEFFLKQYLRGIKYVQMNFYVSTYYNGGYSIKNSKLIPQERSLVLKEQLPEFVLTHFERMGKLEVKLQRAYMLSPIQRDWKILRNAFKTLLHDMFV